MKAFLAVDTSTTMVSAALFVDGKLRAAAAREVPPRSSGSLLELVPPLLDQAGLTFADLEDGFAFGRGPGSYAGLRTCVATIRGWALPFQHPVWAIPSAFAVAAAYFDAHPEAARCTLAGRARRDTCWTAAFSRRPGTPAFVPVQEGAFALCPATPSPVADSLHATPSAEWIGRLRLAGLDSDAPLPIYLHPAVSTAPRYA